MESELEVLYILWQQSSPLTGRMMPLQIYAIPIKLSKIQIYTPIEGKNKITVDESFDQNDQRA